MKKILFILPFFLLTFFIKESFAQGTGSTPTGNTFQITRPSQGFGIDIANGNNPIGNIGVILTNLVTLFFTVGAIGFMIMMFWGAVDWILSGGDKEKIAGARKRIFTAVTGLTVLSLSFVIIVIAGQVLGINALQFGEIKIPGLGAP